MDASPSGAAALADMVTQMIVNVKISAVAAPHGVPSDRYEWCNAYPQACKNPGCAVDECAVCGGHDDPKEIKPFTKDECHKCAKMDEKLTILTCPCGRPRITDDPDQGNDVTIYDHCCGDCAATGGEKHSERYRATKVYLNEVGGFLCPAMEPAEKIDEMVELILAHTKKDQPGHVCLSEEPPRDTRRLTCTEAAHHLNQENAALGLKGEVSEMRLATPTPLQLDDSDREEDWVKATEHVVTAEIGIDLLRTGGRRIPACRALKSGSTGSNPRIQCVTEGDRMCVQCGILASKAFATCVAKIQEDIRPKVTGENEKAEAASPDVVELMSTTLHMIARESKLDLALFQKPLQSVKDSTRDAVARAWVNVGNERIIKPGDIGSRDKQELLDHLCSSGRHIRAFCSIPTVMKRGSLRM